MRSTIVFVSVFGLGLGLGLAACGKGKEEQKAPAAGAGAGTAVRPGTVPSTVPSGSTPPAAAPAVDPAAAAPAPAVDLGSCELTASGALIGHDVVPRNRASVLTDYWLGAAEREQIKASTSGATAQMADALKLLTLNCEGKAVRMSIVPGVGASAKTVPFGPKTYELDQGKGDLAVLVNVGGELLVNPSGTIDVTAFDAHHIAATIALAGTTMDRRELKVSGKLDYVCDGLSGCK